MSNPRISICVIALNSERYVEACIESVLAQSVMPYEVVFVDDGSSDNTYNIVAEYAKQYPAIKLYSLPQTSGVGVARNFAIAKATGDYVWAVDVDDTIAHNSIEIFLKSLLKWGSEVVVAGAKCLDGAGKHRDYFRVDKEYINVSPVQMPELAVYSTGLHWTMVVSRDLLLRYNIKYGENLKCSADGYFLFSLIWKVEKMTFIPNIVYNYSDTAMSTSKRRDLQYYRDDFEVYSFLLSGCKVESDYIYASKRLLYRINEFFDFDLVRYWKNFDQHEQCAILTCLLKLFSQKDVCCYMVEDLIDNPTATTFSFSVISFIIAMKHGDIAVARRLIDIQANSLSFCKKNLITENIIYVLKKISPRVCKIVIFLHKILFKDS